ncbi:MAG TPA: methylated-DNA--[protein]-cysteine S-methyltransferase [Sphingopyxis sp.]|nr:methylated-DNA--[protein]-cysteine S-methyltransferase [Sphingopyxis sp.]
MHNSPIHWQVEDSLFGPMLIAASAQGLCRLSFCEGPEQLQALYPDAALQENGAWTAELALLIGAIVAGDIILNADEPLPFKMDLRGTPFQIAVWQLLLAIPAGETRSYGDLTRMLGTAGADRAVGRANGANPIAIIIPCHRVIRSDGALGGYAYGLEMKRALLQREGALQADLFG